MIIKVEVDKDTSFINFGRGDGPFYLVREISQEPKGITLVQILRSVDGSQKWKQWGNGSGIIGLQTRSIESVSLAELVRQGIDPISARHSERSPLD